MAKISTDKKSVTVQKGDTLWDIANDYKTESDGKTWQELADLNGLPITTKNGVSYVQLVVGQTVKLTGTATTTKKSASYKPKIKLFGLQSDNDQPTLFATWRWDHEHTKAFRVRWKYDTGDGVWFVGEDDSNVTTKTVSEKNGTVYQDLYSVPSNAKRVSLKFKAISQTKKVKTSSGKEKETTYFTGEWSDEVYWKRDEMPPTKPSGPPEVKMDADTSTLTATLTKCGDLNATHIEFYVLKNETKKYNSTTVAITKAGTATMKLAVEDGNTYQVRCRSVRDDEHSDWTEYSGSCTTKPAAPSKITKCKGYSKTEAFLEWTKVANAKTYEVEYTTKKDYFDSSSGTTSKSDITENWCIITGLDAGERYYFRVRAVNESGNKSRWSSIKSTSIGTRPSAPTTWSSTSTVIENEPLTLYWVHNSEDGSSQQMAILELTVNGRIVTGTSGLEIRNTTDEYEKDATSYVVVRQSGSNLIIEGRNPDNLTATKQWASYNLNDELRELKWRVKTSGVTAEVSDFSVLRTVNVYKSPSVSMSVTDQNGNDVSIVSSFPLYVACNATPTSQTPLGYYISVIANEAYETIDHIGREQVVAAGQTVYSKYFDNPNEILTRDENGDLIYVTDTNGALNDIIIELSAGNIDLQNNISYTIVSTVAMNSGLTASAEKTFRVRWQDVEYQPNAEIGIDYDNVSAYIRPYCVDADGNEVSDITLSVYRREFNGTFTEINTGIKPTFSNLLANSDREVVGANEFVQFDDLSPIFDQYGLIEYTISFDLKSADTTNSSRVQIYLQNGSGTKYTFGLYYVDVTTEYQRYSISVTPRIDEETESKSMLAFFGGAYGNGNILSVKNVTVTPRYVWGVYVTDPHPSLDYARYRIVAKTDATGAIGYYDVPGYPVEEVGIIIQWDEEWSNFETNTDDQITSPPWSGSLLRLPYNIDISDKNDPDVSLIEFIGREHPVTFYGTQKGSTSTWNTEIPKKDIETIYALRRLSNWMGDVYVREPSGTGYWANIKVSFPIKHLDVKVPVTFEVTRVEGGM